MSTLDRCRLVGVTSGLAALSLLLCSPQANAQNLVANPGFETGDFTGWDTTLLRGSTLVATAGFDGYNPHSGADFAALGSNGLVSTIQQALTTVIGQTYTVSFWLASDGGTPNLFDATFGSATILNVTNLAAQPYVLYSSQVVATATTTELAIASQNNPGWLALDDVSVTPSAGGSGVAPEPASLALIGTFAVAGIPAIVRRRRK